MGGSSEELKDFIRKAEDCCLKVGTNREIMKNVEGVAKRRLPTQSNTLSIAVKKTRRETVEDNKDAEVRDKDGLEVNFMNDYLGRVEIKIDNLVLSDKIQIPISNDKVSGLREKLLQRTDPSLLCLTVCPPEGTDVTKSNLQDLTFSVIHGRHRFLALKKLDEQGLLSKIRSMESRSITCFVVRADSLIQANYAHLRGNDIQADYVSWLLGNYLATFQKSRFLTNILLSSLEAYWILSLGLPSTLSLQMQRVNPCENIVVAWKTLFRKFRPLSVKYLMLRTLICRSCPNLP